MSEFGKFYILGRCAKFVKYFLHKNPCLQNGVPVLNKLTEKLCMSRNKSRNPGFLTVNFYREHVGVGKEVFGSHNKPSLFQALGVLWETRRSGQKE